MLSITQEILFICFTLWSRLGIFKYFVVQKKVKIENTFLLNHMMQKPTQEPNIGNENNDNPISFNKPFIA